MHVERYSASRRRPRRQRRPWLLGCGVLLGAGALGIVIAAVLLVPLLPQISAQIAGFEPIGDTDSVLLANATPQPAPTLVQAIQSAPTSLSLSAGSYGSVSLAGTTADVRIGESNGASIVQIAFDEADLLAACRSSSAFCSPNGTPVRNARFDIRSGGIVLAGEFNVPQLGLWQAAGAVLQVRNNNQLRVVGVEIDGQLFAAPPNELGQLIAEVETTANDVLRQLSTNVAGQRYSLREIALGNEQLIVTLR